MVDPGMPKKTISVCLNSELVKRAEALGIDVPRSLECHLSEAICAARRERWLAENGVALDSYANYIERNGVFSGALRCF